MKLSLVTVVPDLYDSFLKTSLVGRAQSSKLIQCTVTAFRDYVVPKERIDAPTFGPGAGMLIRPEVVERAIIDKENRYGKAYKVFFSPHGTKLTQIVAQRIATKAQECGHLLLIAGRYEGMDERAEITYADELISLGDFVLMGGDLPVMILLEAVLRLVPGVVGKQISVEEDSFSGPLVDYPHYTEPVEWHNLRVPDVLRSGNHAAIAAWRTDQAVSRTVMHHFEWLRSASINNQQKKLAYDKIPSHYIALLHTDVLVGGAKEQGNTSVTSIDIHDIARSSATYGMKGFFVVTPLIDQQKMVETLLKFWLDEAGKLYNVARHEALKRVFLVATLNDVVANIEAIEGKRPLLLATSARDVGNVQRISYYDQELVWSCQRPVVFIFGTGQGLTEQCVQRCDYLLPPLKGFTEFNHLSVRSAAAVVADRWLGLNQKSCQ